jgi:predicted glycoside hydrolase/deacetylase ChbG (UPF0249 family)
MPQHHPPAQLIITADDFGRDEPCTRAIASALAAGTITATSLMANSCQFELACALARADGVGHRIGVHLVLDEGPALSNEMETYADERGHLQVRRGLRHLEGGLARAVEAELVAQIERVVAAGIRPTHLDSHRHIHTSLPIGRIVVRLARRFGIPYVRPARNLAPHTTLAARGYKWMFNRYLSARIGTADHFGDIVDFYQRHAMYHCAGVIECMTHLDESPRGLENRAVFEGRDFANFIQHFDLIGHAEIRR